MTAFFSSVTFGCGCLDSKRHLGLGKNWEPSPVPLQHGVGGCCTLSFSFSPNFSVCVCPQVITVMCVCSGHPGDVCVPRPSWWCVCVPRPSWWCVCPGHPGDMRGPRPCRWCAWAQAIQAHTYPIKHVLYRENGCGFWVHGLLASLESRTHMSLILMNILID